VRFKRRGVRTVGWRSGGGGGAVLRGDESSKQTTDGRDLLSWSRQCLWHEVDRIKCGNTSDKLRREELSSVTRKVPIPALVVKYFTASRPHPTRAKKSLRLLSHALYPPITGALAVQALVSHCCLNSHPLDSNSHSPAQHQPALSCACSTSAARASNTAQQIMHLSHGGLFALRNANTLASANGPVWTRIQVGRECPLTSPHEHR